jgi:hypothetical protein
MFCIQTASIRNKYKLILLNILKQTFWYENVQGVIAFKKNLLFCELLFI